METAAGDDAGLRYLDDPFRGILRSSDSGVCRPSRRSDRRHSPLPAGPSESGESVLRCRSGGPRPHRRIRRPRQHPSAVRLDGGRRSLRHRQHRVRGHLPTGDGRPFRVLPGGRGSELAPNASGDDARRATAGGIEDLGDLRRQDRRLRLFQSRPGRRRGPVHVLSPALPRGPIGRGPGALDGCAEPVRPGYRHLRRHDPAGAGGALDIARNRALGRHRHAGVSTT